MALSANFMKTKEIEFYIFLDSAGWLRYIGITAKQRGLKLGVQTMFTETAKVQVKNQKNEVIASQEYNKVVFEGVSRDATTKKIVDGGDATKLLGDAIAFYQSKVGEKGNGLLALLADATYAYDLGERNKMRQTLVTAAAGPDKAIEKGIKDLMAARAAAGKPVTEEWARAKVVAMMEAE